MCEPTTIMMGVGMAASAAMAAKSSSDQSSAQKKAGKYSAQSAGRQQAQAEYEAKQIMEQANEQARQVRAEAISVRGKQIANQAASGVVVGDGSAQAMVDEVTRLAEQDAVAYLMSGANGSISANEKGRLARMDGEFQSKQFYTQASNTMTNGMIGAGASLLSSAGSLGAKSGMTFGEMGGNIKGAFTGSPFNGSGMYRSFGN
ncbi:virion core protein, T7 gp14 family [Methylomonas koyamae]|uniref:virion core protein, T7 gp14 family n=1 Tax=Methylomonas koyamae TaxID=702114 RepID=UPI0006CF5F7E|nr:hypothetical protein [Methylomonas koyamae]BBL57005.1 hypothetical protein MKFW12EY_06180 [Methylomonas koyamae]